MTSDNKDDKKSGFNPLNMFKKQIPLEIKLANEAEKALEKDNNVPIYRSGNLAEISKNTVQAASDNFITQLADSGAIEAAEELIRAYNTEIDQNYPALKIEALNLSIDKIYDRVTNIDTNAKVAPAEKIVSELQGALLSRQMHSEALRERAITGIQSEIDRIENSQKFEINTAEKAYLDAQERLLKSIRTGYGEIVKSYETMIENLSKIPTENRKDIEKIKASQEAIKIKMEAFKNAIKEGGDIAIKRKNFIDAIKNLHDARIKQPQDEKLIENMLSALEVALNEFAEPLDPTLFVPTEAEVNIRNLEGVASKEELTGYIKVLDGLKTAHQGYMEVANARKIQEITPLIIKRAETDMKINEIQGNAEVAKQLKTLNEEKNARVTEKEVVDKEIAALTTTITTLKLPPASTIKTSDNLLSTMQTEFTQAISDIGKRNIRESKEAPEKPADFSYDFNFLGLMRLTIHNTAIKIGIDDQSRYQRETDVIKKINEKIKKENLSWGGFDEEKDSVITIEFPENVSAAITKTTEKYESLKLATGTLNKEAEITARSDMDASTKATTLLLQEELTTIDDKLKTRYQALLKEVAGDDKIQTILNGIESTNSKYKQQLSLIDDIKKTPAATLTLDQKSQLKEAQKEIQALKEQQAKLETEYGEICIEVGQRLYSDKEYQQISLTQQAYARSLSNVGLIKEANLLNNDLNTLEALQKNKVKGETKGGYAINQEKRALHEEQEREYAHLFSEIPIIYKSAQEVQETTLKCRVTVGANIAFERYPAIPFEDLQKGITLDSSLMMDLYSKLNVLKTLKTAILNRTELRPVDVDQIREKLELLGISLNEGLYKPENSKDLLAFLTDNITAYETTISNLQGDPMALDNPAAFAKALLAQAQQIDRKTGATALALPEKLAEFLGILSNKNQEFTFSEKIVAGLHQEYLELRTLEQSGHKGQQANNDRLLGIYNEIDRRLQLGLDPANLKDTKVRDYQAKFVGETMPKLMRDLNQEFVKAQPVGAEKEYVSAQVAAVTQHQQVIETIRKFQDNVKTLMQYQEGFTPEKEQKAAAERATSEPIREASVAKLRELFEGSGKLAQAGVLEKNIMGGVEYKAQQAAAERKKAAHKAAPKPLSIKAQEKIKARMPLIEEIATDTSSLMLSRSGSTVARRSSTTTQSSSEISTGSDSRRSSLDPTKKH